MTPATFLWRRLDAPGHDCCRLQPQRAGYLLSGVAVFREGRRTCRLDYEVFADTAFRTRRASVRGFVGQAEIDLRIRTTATGGWEVNGAAVPAVAGCVDVDLGFTPATNLLAIRRLALRVGQEAQAPAAYLAVPQLRFTLLPQRYQRLSRTEYDYESPTFGYRERLRVNAFGAVVDYPGLFEMESGGLRATGKG